MKITRRYIGGKRGLYWCKGCCFSARRGRGFAEVEGLGVCLGVWWR